MSTLPDNELDLEKLFLPAWAQQESSSAKYAKYELPDERPDRRGDRRGPRPPRREGMFGPRRDDRSRGDRPRGDRPPGSRPAGGPGDRKGQPRHDRRPDRREERREPPPPLPELNVSLVPDEKGVESLARQIKMTGRAYPLFDIAQMILQKPERHTAVFSIKKNPQGEPIQPLFVCALDDTLWLSEDEAVSHVLRKHFDTFYQTERTAAEPPKGKYTFVAQCGMSGVILGPPNYHDYQNQLRKLHAERFSRMPFEVYKSRVRIVKDEEVVKKWVEDQSWKTEFTCLNLPEPLRLKSMDEVEKHFREVHKDNIIKPAETHTMSGTAARNIRSPELARLSRSVWEDQRRFPLQIATVLSQQFAGHGLQFFKVNKSITHVCVARPHYLDLAAAPVSEGVKKIVEFINTHPRCTRKVLVEALAPTPPAPTVIPVTSPSPAAEVPPGAEQPPATPAPDPNQPTPEQTLVISDLHWLIHQGHVIEFANGTLETAKKPLPKPPKTEKPKSAEASVAATGTPAIPGDSTPAAEPQWEVTTTNLAEGISAAEIPVAPAEQGAPGEVVTAPETNPPAPTEPVLPVQAAAELITTEPAASAAENAPAPEAPTQPGPEGEKSAPPSI